MTALPSAARPAGRSSRSSACWPSRSGRRSPRRGPRPAPSASTSRSSRLRRPPSRWSTGRRRSGGRGLVPAPDLGPISIPAPGQVADVDPAAELARIRADVDFWAARLDRPSRRHRRRRQARRGRCRGGPADRRRHRLPARRAGDRRGPRGPARVRAGAGDAGQPPRLAPPVPRGARPRPLDPRPLAGRRDGVRRPRRRVARAGRPRRPPRPPTRGSRWSRTAPRRASGPPGWRSSRAIPLPRSPPTLRPLPRRSTRASRATPSASTTSRSARR